MSEPEHDSGWRYRAVRGMSLLPGPLRRALWRARRTIARKRRRRRESRGDWSLSRPALHDMDMRLERHVGAGPGFFVEAGANDGYQQSNTYSLERIRGWRGLLVEPVPELAREAARERPGARVFNCALTASEAPGDTMRLLYGGLMTVVADARSDSAEWVAAAHAVAQEEPAHEFEVPARRLSSLLDETEAPAVDLLSLDVEGYEAEVLRGLDLERHAPRLLLIEARDGEARRRLEAVLTDRYRLVEQMSPVDLLYARVDTGSPPASTRP